MSEQAYHQSAQEAHDAISIAMHEAEALLPRAVTTQHWVAGHHSPASWRSTESWLRNQPDYDPLVLETLTDLALMSEALACLKSVAITAEEKEKPIGSLKLAKVRRTA